LGGNKPEKGREPTVRNLGAKPTEGGAPKKEGKTGVNVLRISSRIIVFIAKKQNSGEL